MRSDMDHTVLPANYTMPAFTPQLQSITALWLVLILPSPGLGLAVPTAHLFLNLLQLSFTLNFTSIQQRRSNRRLQSF